jgi:DNA-binding transcriptional regulator YiaG
LRRFLFALADCAGRFKCDPANAKRFLFLLVSQIGTKLNANDVHGIAEALLVSLPVSASLDCDGHGWGSLSCNRLSAAYIRHDMKSSRKVSFSDTPLAACRSNPDKDGMTPETCRAARGLLGLSQAELAERAGVTPLTVRKYELGKTGLAHRTWRSIRAVLIQAGAIFIEEDDVAGPGVRLKKVRGQK